jgi:hypothetical protein
MKLLKVIRLSCTLSLVSTVPMSAASSAEKPCASGRHDTLAATLTGVTHVVIDSDPGEMHVFGEEGHSELTATARICNGHAVPHIRVERADSTLYVTITRTDGGHRWLGSSTSMLTTISVDKRSSVEIVKMQGPTTIRKVRAARVYDGLGMLSIVDVSEDVNVNKGIGLTSIANVSGDVGVTSGAGQLSISDVSGNVRIDAGAGRLSVHNVVKDVVIDADTSGEIRIERVGGNVRVAQDTSGAISVHDVGGTFTVEEKFSGRIAYTNVSGEVRIPRISTRKRVGPKP